MDVDFEGHDTVTSSLAEELTTINENEILKNSESDSSISSIHETTNISSIFDENNNNMNNFDAVFNEFSGGASGSGAPSKMTFDNNFFRTNLDLDFTNLHHQNMVENNQNDIILKSEDSPKSEFEVTLIQEKQTENNTFEQAQKMMDDFYLKLEAESKNSQENNFLKKNVSDLSFEEIDFTKEIPLKRKQFLEMVLRIFSWKILVTGANFANILMDFGEILSTSS